MLENHSQPRSWMVNKECRERVHLAVIMRATLLLLILAGLMNTIVLSTPCSSQSSAPYELIYRTDSTTELTGSMTMKCRDGDTAEELDTSEINFFLNCSSGTNNCLSLRERADIRVVAVGRTGVQFNLTREDDGYYTCGKRGDDTHGANYTTSLPKTLVSFQTIVPLHLPLPQTNITVMSGDKAVLRCPIQPGALLQQYSVRWRKGSTAIAQLTNPQGQLERTDYRYQIDRGTYSLIVNPVTVNDTSTDYLCEVFVAIPCTGAKRMLQPSPPVTLSLKVIANKPTSPEADSTTVPSDEGPIYAADSTTIVTTSLLYSCFNAIAVTSFIVMF